MSTKTVSVAAKNAAGKAAADFIRPGMLIGLGTGSTAFFFMKHLGEKCKHGLIVKAIATSQESEDVARECGIPLIDSNTVISLDIIVDGADEIDDDKQMIKGGGGALVREKIAAAMSKKKIYIIDQTKLVKRLQGPLPIEIIPFGYKATLNHLEEKGYKGKLRTKIDNELYITQNRNYIFDAQIDTSKKSADAIENQLKKIPGVVETGLFLHVAEIIIVGYPNGHVEFLQ